MMKSYLFAGMLAACLSACSSDASAQMAVDINGTTLSSNECLQPWTDGTKICTSTSSGGFRLMTFDHPEHKRWVIQYRNQGLRANDGGRPHVAGAYEATILRDGTALKTYKIDRHAMGQEWSHEEGQRKYIRSPRDLVARGDIPAHEVPSKYALVWPGPKVSGGPVRQGDPKPQRDVGLYEPLTSGPLVAWMPAQGLHPEVHWTSALSRWLLYGASRKGQTLSEPAVIKSSAESFASFPAFLTHKGKLSPVDWRARYYADAAFERPQWAQNNNHVPVPNPAAFQDEEDGRGLKLDTPHLACPSWEQFLLDGDPYHLRALQFCANWGIGATGNQYRQLGSKDGTAALIVARQEPRGYGKVLMLVWRAYEYTPDGSWEWLLPKSYFKQALDDTAYQAKHYLSKLPHNRNGELVRDYWDLRNAIYARGLGHMEVQALWSIGWVMTKGWEDFRPLYEQIGTGMRDGLDAFGPAMLHLMHDVRRAKNSHGKKMNFETHQDAAAWVRANLDKPAFGPNRPGYRQVWQEERFEGVFKSLVQLGLEEWRPYAEMFVKSRMLLSLCNAQQQAPNGQKSPDCPKIKHGYNDVSADWSFAYSANETASNGFESGPSSAENISPAKPAGSTVAQSASSPTDNLPNPGVISLPDPGAVNLPGAGEAKLPGGR